MSRSHQSNVPPVIAIHGGAYPLGIAERSARHRRIALDAMEEAVRAGHRVLSRGGTALAAVEAAVIVMEDAPCLNAGRGAVLNAQGDIELEASIMDGRTLAAGAVTGVRTVQNPIRLAHAVMAHTPCVMLGFAAAEEFAQAHGIPTVAPEYFRTPARVLALQLEQARARSSRPRVAAEAGTVGAVALDRHGHLAAATSTGGRTNKWAGRIGDSPIIGAGTYADDRACAVSATGHGEFFIRAAVAHEIAARVRHRGDSVQAAARHVVHRELERLGGTGGVVAVDRAGRIAMPFNTDAMNRASIDARGRMVVAIGRTIERRAGVD